MTSPITPDLREARRFLAVLDPAPDARFGFRTFDDRGQDPRLAVKAFGTLHDAVRQSTNAGQNGLRCLPARLLAHMQRRGAGAFVMVNAIDGAGQRCDNVTAVHALFVDCDTRDAVDQLHKFVARSGLTPSTIVASGGIADGADKLQAYWLIAGCPVREFSAAQMLLCSRIGSDPAVKDAARVLRLPGFWHQKGAPRMTRIVSASDNKYDCGSFLARVRARPQVFDPGQASTRPARTGAAAPARTRGGTTRMPATARLNELFARYDGLVKPAIRELLREVGAAGCGRHYAVVAIAGRLVFQQWTDAQALGFVVPLANGDFGDGDWTGEVRNALAHARRCQDARLATARVAQWA